MRNFLFWLASEAPSDVVIDDTWYSPGVVGFLATFGVAGAAILRRVRRVRYRAEIVQKLDLEQQLGESASAEDSKP
jgi:hypothetical protein